MVVEAEERLEGTLGAQRDQAALRLRRMLDRDGPFGPTSRRDPELAQHCLRQALNRRVLE